MTINSITYNTIIDKVKTYIKTNCINISNYAGLPAAFKPGYTNTGVISTNGGKYTSRYSVSISKSVSQVSASTVDSEMTSFLTSIGLTNVNDICKPNNYLALINDITTFCSTHLAFTTSQYSTNKYLIYQAGGTYMSPETLYTPADTRLVYATDVTQLINSLITILKQNIRNYVCTYNVTLS